jgi:hypothetical protein
MVHKGTFAEYSLGEFDLLGVDADEVDVVTGMSVRME